MVVRPYLAKWAIFIFCSISFGDDEPDADAAFEIKHLFCEHIGCRVTKNRASGVVSLCTCLYSVYKFQHRYQNVFTRKPNWAHPMAQGAW